MIFTRPRDEREYVLRRERDLPPESQTKFLLRDLRERDRVKVMDSFRVSVSDEGNEIGGSGTRTYMAIRAGLVGWRNAKFDDGTDVPFTTEGGSKVPTDETLAMIDWEAKLELAEEILSASFPTEEDKGK